MPETMGRGRYRAWGIH
ncbi:hypothetical protein [Bradyrhizobium canariense]